MYVKSAYSVELTRYSVQNVSKEFLIKTLKEKLEKVNREISDYERDKKELEQAIEESEKLL